MRVGSRTSETPHCFSAKRLQRKSTRQKMADAQQEPAESTRWPACESNPDVMNKVNSTIYHAWKKIKYFENSKRLLKILVSTRPWPP